MNKISSLRTILTQKKELDFIPTNMANAAAKKAAAARASTSSVYFPIIASTNIVYFFIRIIWKWESYDKFQAFMSALLWILTVFAYNGIKEDAAATSTQSSKSKKLAGGASLDLLGLVVLVQFGSACLSDSFFWMLLIVPVWGARKLYSTMKGLSPSSSENDPSHNDNFSSQESEETKARRQRRAEKRRQKRM